jgi:hypothetical protein
VNRRFEGTYQLHLQSRTLAEHETSMYQVVCYETSVHIRTTRRYISENGSIHNYRCENLKFYGLIISESQYSRILHNHKKQNKNTRDSRL